jgi:hypothetical protein
MPITWMSETTTLASTCQGRLRRRVPMCSGTRRSSAMMTGITTHHIPVLVPSHTAGSHASNGSPRRRWSRLATSRLTW